VVPTKEPDLQGALDPTVDESPDESDSDSDSDIEELTEAIPIPTLPHPIEVPGALGPREPNFLEDTTSSEPQRSNRVGADLVTGPSGVVVPCSPSPGQEEMVPTTEFGIGEDPWRRRVVTEDSTANSREPDPQQGMQEASSSSNLEPSLHQPPIPGMRNLESGAERDLSPVMNRDWHEDYRKCTRWSEVLRVIESDGKTWPEGFTHLAGRLYKDNVLCIPQGLTEEVIRAQHSYARHPGGDRLWQEMSRWYCLADEAAAKRFTVMVKKSVRCFRLLTLIVGFERAT